MVTVGSSGSSVVVGGVGVSVPPGGVNVSSPPLGTGIVRPPPGTDVIPGPGSGVEPGMVNVFARYAGDYLFDSIAELNVRDGDNLSVDGYDIAFGFSSKSS